MKPSPWIALRESLVSRDQRPGKDWLTIEEVAKEMGLSVGRARLLCQQLIAQDRLEMQMVAQRAYYRRVG